MRVPDQALDELREVGFVVVPGVVAGDDLTEAQDALWDNYPRPDEYFADPEAHREYVRHQFAGLRTGPFPSWDLTRLAFHPDLVDAAERFCGTTDLQLYKIELWAKYRSEVDYDQSHHRDFGNHSLVVPRRDGRWPQLTTFTLLSDVTEHDGPTKVVPRPIGDQVPFLDPGAEPHATHLPMGELFDHEVSVTGPAGSLFLYTTDVLHRGSAIRGARGARFALLADYSARGNPWMNKVAWPDRALLPGFRQLMERATVRERDLFGFPAPGHEYWCDQTLDDVQARYPGLDMSPYRDAMP